MQRFRGDPKTFLGLAMPNQYSQTVKSKNQAGFGEIILGQNPQTLYIVLLYYMIPPHIVWLVFTPFEYLITIITGNNH